MIESCYQTAREILSKVGRSATPKVSESLFGISHGELIGDGMFATNHGSVLGVCHSDLSGFLADENSFRFGTPGLLREQAEDTRFSHLLIDVGAFRAGPWIGADSGAYPNLSEEIFDAGRIFRASGRIVILLRRPSYVPGIAYPRIESTSTCLFNEIPEVDLEEGATQSSVWRMLHQFSSKPEN